MPPRSVSFKSVWDKILSKNDSVPESLEGTHTPTPLVVHSPLIPEKSPSSTSSKRFLIGRPLRISPNYNASDFYSEIKDYSADSLDDFNGSSSFDYSDINDYKITTLAFSDKIKSDRSNHQMEDDYPNFPSPTEDIDSLNTSISDTNINQFALKVESTNSSPKQTDIKHSNTTLNTPKDDENSKMSMVFRDINMQESFEDKITPRTETLTLDESNYSVRFTQSSQGSDHGQDVVKILVFTDTHLGYKEDDVYRGQDSTNTFEELLIMAKYLDVDFILHSGDLFDKNMPSRAIMYRTMDLISKYLLNIGNKININKSVMTGIDRSMASKVFSNDKNNNISIPCNFNTHDHQVPFFVIHGNHDNPTYQNSLSPIDILDVAGLVTYFGRVFDLNNVIIKPILISKSTINIALYGIGWIKDERLVELFENNKITFEQCDDFDKYYKIFLIHQNRYPRRGNNVKDFITTRMIPDWFDLVIWGHEHESIKFPEKNPFENFQILQLGSTIQTCLVPGEIPPKHACLIHISNDSVKFYPISLLTSRKFISDEIETLNNFDYSCDESKDLYTYLKNAVEKILHNSENNFITELNSLSLTEELDIPQITKLKKLIETASAPLVRIKLDSKMFDNINPKIFGSSFIGKVANPNDMLKVSSKREQGNDSNVLKLNHTSKCVKDQVLSSVEENCRLSLLLETELNDVVSRFANGMETQVIMEYVRKRVNDVQEFLKRQVKDSVSDQLSDDLFSDLIDKFIKDKTNSERINPKLKRHDSCLNYIAERTDATIHEFNERREDIFDGEEEKITNFKRRKNVKK